MEPLAARELRHNLRTPINHVLGYVEMLLEDARDAGRRDLMGDLEQVHEAAHQALARVNEALAATAVSQETLDSLREALSAPVQRIVTAAEAVARGAPEWSPDIARIRTGAETLLALAGGPAPPNAAAASDLPAPAGPRATRGRLLVVDDNQGNRHMLRRQLERHGYEAAEAPGGREALERLGQERFDLVLLDIMMPEMDGFQVLAAMKGDAALRDVPVVVVSAVDEMNSVVRSIEMGAEDYLLKPFDPVLLRARVDASVEKQRLRNELLVQERLASLGVLAAGVAHELRNPLNFVTNFADLSAELVRELRGEIERLDGDARRNLLELAADLERNVLKIKEHGSRADNVVESMLLHSRVQSGERRPTDLNRLVAEAVNLAYHGFRARAGAFNATIEAAYDPAVGLVNVNPGDISRVVLNIAGNAFYAVRGVPGPLVRVETRAGGNTVEIRIRDNGPGIARDIQDRIFEAFFTTKPPGEGTGLGLSLSYDIVVNGHQGGIRVQSEPGNGAEFIVVLPKEAA